MAQEHAETATRSPALLIVLTVIIIIPSLLANVARLWTRRIILKIFGAEDWLMLGTLGCTVVLLVWLFLGIILALFLPSSKC